MSIWPWNRNRNNNGYHLLTNINDDDSSELLDDNTTMLSNATTVTQGSPQNPRICFCKVSDRYARPMYMILSILVLCLMSATSLSLGWYSWFGLPKQPVIDKSIDAFSIPNHEAYKRYDSFKIALSTAKSFKRYKRDTTQKMSRISDLDYMHNDNSKRKKRSIHNRCLIGYQTIAHWKMHLVYLAKGDDEHNMFTKERLEIVHKIEKNIMNHPQFSQFCFKDVKMMNKDPAISANQGCAPFNSLMTYFFPTRDSVTGKIHYDGLGTHIDDVNSALKFAMNHDTFYYFVDEKINRTYPKSRLIRTEVLFGAPLPGFDCFGNMDKQAELFKKFEITYIDILSKASNDKVHVLYGGNELFDYEIDSTFWSDIKMAAYSLGSIIVIMFVLTSFSPWLTICGIWSIMLSFPLAFFLYRIVFKINALGILNGAAAFVIIGIGVDDVFVFVNIFHQTTDLPDICSKMKHTIRIAGKATFFTSFTTASAFAANMASSIPAVYEFGLFMCLIVSCCWLCVIIMMPPTLYLWQTAFSKCENKCYNCCNHGKSNESESDITQSSSLSDADVLMLPIDDGGIATFNTAETADEPMLSLEPVFATTRSEINYTSRPGFNIGHQIQAFLTSCIAPIITSTKGKWIIIGIHVCMLLTAIGLITQLHPASHPPQLFHPDTNLQQLLDLKANFSVLDTIRCDKCSGLYLKSSPLSSTKPPSIPNLPPFIHLSTSLALPIVTTTKSPKSTQDFVSRTARPVSSTTTPSPTTLPTTVKTTTTQRVRHEMRRHPTPPPRSNSHKHHENIGKANPVSGSFDSCADNSCNNMKARPRLQSGTTVYVVFGIKGLILPKVRSGHVIDENKGKVEYNDALPKSFTGSHGLQVIKDLCRLCHLIANNHDLVRNASAQCIPEGIPGSLHSEIQMIEECRNLPHSIVSYQHHLPDHAVGGLTEDNKIKWLGFAFESTTSEGDAYFSAYKKYLAWNEFIDHIKDNVLSKDSPLQDIFQTSKFWRKVMMEVVAVYSAIYGLFLSLVICIIAVSIFTGHILLLLIVVISIIAMICSVVGIFYLAGWEMGAIEAISLSILVGSSVDYCVHLVEGYILAGNTLTTTDKSNSVIRKERTLQALRHIGVAIISSAITTIIAAVPLTQTIIQPFSKFGDILLINTSVSILFTITLCAPLLSAIAPAKFKGTFKSTIKALILTFLFVGCVLLILYGVSKFIFAIPGPNGNPIFP